MQSKCKLRVPMNNIYETQFGFYQFCFEYLGGAGVGGLFVPTCYWKDRFRQNVSSIFLVWHQQHFSWWSLHGICRPEADVFH